MTQPILIEENHQTIIRSILQAYIRDNLVWIYGSRLKGNPKPHSDVDLVIVDPPHVSEETLSQIKLSLEESDLPYRVDVSLWSQLSAQFKQLVEEKHHVFFLPHTK